MSEIWLYEPGFQYFSWTVEFYGRFREEFEIFENQILFDENDTIEIARQKVDDFLVRLEKLESFQ
jgi:hypothetical protein